MDNLAQKITVINTINNEDDVKLDKEPSFDEYIQIIESMSKYLRSRRMQEILNG